MVDSYTKRLAYSPRGYYWELITKRPGGDWKFDVWYLTAGEDESILPTKKWKKLLTPEKKLLILQVKQNYLKTPMLYDHKLYGVKIYKLILERGIKDINTFHKRVSRTK